MKMVELSSLSASDAARFCDYLIGKGITAASVRRVFGTVKANTNIAIREYGHEGTQVVNFIRHHWFQKHGSRTKVLFHSPYFSFRSLFTPSNALNKWLHANFLRDIVIHGFRNAMRDRLSAVNCPSEMIGQIGGWSKRSVGEGYSVLQTKQWMTRSVLHHK